MQKGFLTPLLIGIIVILIAAVAFFVFNNQKTKGTSESGISGTFDINGTVPQGATIAVSQKPAHVKGAAYQEIISGVSPQDKAGWSFADAESGKSYEIQGVMTLNGQKLYESDPIFITAPATDEVLVFNVESQNPKGTAVLSGSLDLNGYIPQGATVTLQGKTQNDPSFISYAQNIPAKDLQPVSYNDAIAGLGYTVQAVLYDGNGVQIGISPEAQVVAPAGNEVFAINSTAQPPVTPTPTTASNTPTPTPANSAISGAINFNGAAQQNTRIVVFQRVTGTGNFQVAVDNIQPVNGAAWSWAGATAGTTYDVLAILKQHQSNGTDQDISDSNSITVAAPASNESLTINSGFSLPAAGGTISFSCGNYNAGGNNWSGSISFQSINNAQSYWFQIGTTNGGDDLTNQTANATNTTSQIQNLTFNNGVIYYARYAYANVPNVPDYSSQFSPFSQTTSYRCAQ